MRRIVPYLSLLAFTCGDILAQSVVVPNANANVRGVAGLNTLTRDTGNPRTYMLGYPATELAGIPPGSIITGVSFRSDMTPGFNAPTWPPVDTTWSNYEVTVGYAVPPGSWTGTFANNFMNTPIAPVLVRTGPMVIEPGSFTFNGSLPPPVPNRFSDFFWDFQKPFPYIGGDLGILFTHPGSNQTGAYYLDYINSAAATGVGFSTTTFQAASGTSTVFCITRIHYGYGGGCPGTGGMVPNLVQTNDVTGGGSVSFAIGNAVANGIALYVVGARPSSVMLSNGCTLLTTPTILIPAGLSAKGRNTLATSFPPGLSLTAYVQAFVVDAGAPGGFAATNGTTLTVMP
jgi:hypothetical protein